MAKSHGENRRRVYCCLNYLRLFILHLPLLYFHVISDNLGIETGLGVLIGIEYPGYLLHFMHIFTLYIFSISRTYTIVYIR